MNAIVRPPAPPLPPQASPSSVAFTGRRSDFRRLVWRGAGLELITLGFYRFWLTTDMRRHLWSHTAVEGDAPEYTGTAKELLIGFLFAMAVLLPVYIAYFVLGMEAERLQAFASLPMIVFLVLFLEFAVYRARRYRLTRTIWRGVRFNMGGSGWGYAWRSSLWMLWTALSAGIALPWRQAALERYKMRHTGYGDLAGRFDATGGQLFKRAWWIWVLAWPSMFFLVPLPFLYGAYKAIEWRWWISGLRFGEVRFESSMSGSDLFDLYWKVIGWSTLITVLLMVWIGTAIGVPLAMADIPWGGDDPEAVMLEILNVVMEPGVLIASAVGYILAALASVIAVRMYLVHDIWQRVAASTRIHNLAAAGNVAVKGELAGALGEGLADGLGIGGF